MKIIIPSLKKESQSQASKINLKSKEAITCLKKND
jgi:hypothetical protein